MCPAVCVGDDGATCVSSRLAQAFSWLGSVLRKQSQCASDFQVPTYFLFTDVPWAKGSHVAKL